MPRAKCLDCGTEQVVGLGQFCENCGSARLRPATDAPDESA